MAAFVERRAPATILSRTLLRNRVFVLANVSFVMTMLALFAVGFLMPFYFEELRGNAVAGRALSAGRSTLPLEQVQALQQTFVSALHGAFVVCAALAAIGVVTALAHGR